MNSSMCICPLSVHSQPRTKQCHHAPSQHYFSMHAWVVSLVPLCNGPLPLADHRRCPLLSTATPSSLKGHVRTYIHTQAPLMPARSPATLAPLTPRTVSTPSLASPPGCRCPGPCCACTPCPQAKARWHTPPTATTRQQAKALWWWPGLWWSSMHAAVAARILTGGLWVVITWFEGWRVRDGVLAHYKQRASLALPLLPRACCQTGMLKKQFWMSTSWMGAHHTQLLNTPVRCTCHVRLNESALSGGGVARCLGTRGDPFCHFPELMLSLPQFHT